MINTVCKADQILSPNFEYLSACLYNSSIVASRSRDSEWKNELVSPELLRKFRRTASMLYESICWTAPPNLLVKSRMDSSSRLKIVYKELMFPLCRSEHGYWETNAAHISLNELIDPRGSLWNQARAGPFKLAENTLHNRRLSLALSIIA